ncbi:MAG TPA: hypothetical protein VK050_06440 [Flavobacteriaceae bacterium]|nr:hypothetical protein [Flavobacteriaceae bacterium]
MRTQIPSSDNPEQPKCNIIKTGEVLMSTSNSKLTLNEMFRKKEYILYCMEKTSSFKRGKLLELHVHLQDLNNAMLEKLSPKYVDEATILNKKMKRNSFISFLEEEIEKWKDNARVYVSVRYDLDEAKNSFIRVAAFEDVLERYLEIFKEEEEEEDKSE